MKTAVTCLQEMMVKMGQTPEYECIAQSGPQHQAMFEYRCKVFGIVVTAAARSKKEAKQEVAKVMLQELLAQGYPVPPPFGRPTVQTDDGVEGRCADARSYVALLKELCEEYRLPGAEYVLVSDTGPPHLRHFTMRAVVGQHERLATATTKKVARQLAAEKLYSYLRENLARLTKDFDEDEALVRAHEKAMERYTAPADQQRPNLGQRIADYHLGLVDKLDAETLERGAKLVSEGRDESPERVLLEVTAALGLNVEAETLDAESGSLAVLRVTGAPPDLVTAATTGPAAAADMLRYLSTALQWR